MLWPGPLPDWAPSWLVQYQLLAIAGLSTGSWANCGHLTDAEPSVLEAIDQVERCIACATGDWQPRGDVRCASCEIVQPPDHRFGWGAMGATRTQFVAFALCASCYWIYSPTLQDLAVNSDV